ncbi:hypothetical protein VTI28DRAFT_9499 [Corynascus sepedonium]
MIHEYRPKNTASSYEPKQEEFREFCRRKEYSDGDAVIEDKLLLFLVEEVANRPLKTKSPKVNDGILQENTRLAWRSANYADKGRETLLDGYTEQEFEQTFCLAIICLYVVVIGVMPSF